MATAPDTEALATFLTALAEFFEAADTVVDDALADHFGEDTAVDWVVVSLELFAEQLREPQPEPPMTSQLSRGSV